MSLHDAWTALRHGGNLLSPTALDSLPAPESPPWSLADRLRAALVALDPETLEPSTLGALLDVALEDACGLREGWRKGNALGAADKEKLLDGTELRPRRLWTGPDGETLAVFTTPATRIGVGKGRRPAAQVVEYLRRRALPLGLLTNGRQWRLIWADIDSLAWAEWEAERWLDAGTLSDELTVLRRVLSSSSLLKAGADLSPLLAAVRDTRRGQGKLSAALGENVRRAVETLLRSRQSLIAPTWEEHRGANLYVAACHFVMRLVVTLFAEARELLPVDNRVYHQAYGLRGLLDQLDRLTPERRKARQMAWPRLLALFRLLHQGSPHPDLTLQEYGGDLFRPGNRDGDGVQRALALLEALPDPPDDDVIHRMLVLLTRTNQKIREGSGWRTVAAPVDFTELTSEYIGILYEGLLDYELHRAGAEPVLFLNLGDQPALPLDRLEAMDDKTLATLVEKAKVKKQLTAGGDEEEGGDAGIDDADTQEDVENGENEGTDEEPEAPTSADTLDLDAARLAARDRAIAWGRRAAEIGKLVKKPRGRAAEAGAAWTAQLDAAAEQLIADVKLPGELYLVRWGGTRKGAGTFYTRPQLTLPTVRRTLEPLIYEQKGDTGGVVRPAETILSLKVCDPAMGSGSFLVAALRVLTEAVVESLHVHGRIERTNGRTVVRCELLPEADRSLSAEGFQERLETIVRRAVVEHCLYGVDRDPLAVELARVALWVETLDRRLPFTFLDHKLRCGDALVGTWLDRFRDYPLLCFDRQSPDLKYKGVHHEADVWHTALKKKRAQAIARQVEILNGQLRLETTSDEELKTAVDRIRRLYRELRTVPAGQPDKRARIWRERIQPDTALAKVREAFDTWCALWFWPLDELDAMPLPGDLHAPSEEARSAVKSLRDSRRFFHWEIEFPDVFTEKDAGFDAVVGNPPWEIQKPNSKEFFSNHDPLYRAYGKQEALAEQRALFKARPAIEAQWLAYVGDFKDRGNFVRNASEPFGDIEDENGKPGVVLVTRQVETTRKLHQKWSSERRKRSSLSDPAHPFRYQGSADLNTYKMFVEAGHALLRSGGQIGMIVPSGLYTDKGAGGLRRLLLNSCGWRWLYGFENRNKVFDIHRSFKFCVIIAEKGERTSAIQAAFMHHDLEDWAARKDVFFYPAKRVTAFGPKSLSILEVLSEKDLTILTKIYANSVLLGQDKPGGWGIQYAREFDMTNDSKLFVPRAKAEEQGFRPDIYGRWVNDAGELLLPLYQGAMIHQHDPFFKSWVPSQNGTPGWNRCDDWPVMRPKYLLRRADYLASSKTAKGPRLAFRDIARGTDQRTMISSIIPAFPAGNKVPYLVFKAAGLEVACSGILNSLTFDWGQRIRQGSTSLNWYIIEESPLPLLEEVVHLISGLVIRLAAIGELNAQRWNKNPRQLWRRLWAITPHERLRLRCMLDAIVTVLYGLERDDFAWILKDCDHSKAYLSEKAFCRRLDPKGFWRVDKIEDPELRHTVLSLAAFDDLQRAIAAAGDRDAGIQAFCDQNDRDGWMLPETLCIAELGLTRTVDIGEYDERARTPQPVRSRMGERFLDWQLAQTPEESWAECERHAKAILEGMPAPPSEPAPAAAQPASSQPRLPGMEP